MKNKVKEILTGWKNVLWTDEAVNTLSEERMKVCNGCPMKQKMLNIDVCGSCHCPLVAKTKSPESKCPLDKWEAIEPGKGTN